MLLKPSKTVPMLRTDSRDQLGIHAYALSQTTDILRPLNLIDSNGDSNSGSQRQASAVDGTKRHMDVCMAPGGMSGRENGRSSTADRKARSSPIGSHAGSHADEQPSGDPDEYEQRDGTRPRSWTDLNRSGYPHMELRIRRLGGRRLGGEARAGDCRPLFRGISSWLRNRSDDARKCPAGQEVGR
jgi:hypothetical protein